MAMLMTELNEWWREQKSLGIKKQEKPGERAEAKSIREAALAGMSKDSGM